MDSRPEELTVSDLVAMLWKRKGVVLGLFVACAVLSVGYTFVSPARWQARASLLLPLPDSQGGGSSAITALIGQGTASPLDVLEGVLASRKAVVMIADKTGYDPDKLDDNLSGKGDSPSNQFVILFEDTDAEKAKSVVRESVHVLDGLTKDVGISVAERTKVELEKALKAKNEELRAAEERLTDYQKTAKTAPDPTAPYSAAAYLKAYEDAKLELGKVERQLSAAKAIAASASKQPADLPNGLPDNQALRDKLIEKENALAVARIHFGETSSEVATLRQEVQVIRDSLRAELLRRYQAVSTNVDSKVADLEASRQLLAWQVQALKGLADVAPKEVADQMRLAREVQTLSGVVQGIREQYEKTRIDADVEKVRWTVLEEPFVVKPAVNKRYGRAAAFGGALGLLIGAIIAFWKESVAGKLRRVGA